MYRGLLLITVFFLSSAFGMTAQDSVCSPERDAVIELVSDRCDAIGRNEVCYGNHLIESETTDGEFNQSGDIIPVEYLHNLQTIDGTPTNDEWGIAVFNILANLPETLPGQSVMMIVFGDTTITTNADASEEYPEPMQAFYLRTGVGRPKCNEVVDRGLLIQNPSGETVTLSINDFGVTVNSTALFLAEDQQQLSVTTYEGIVTLTSDDETIVVPAGFTATIGAEASEAVIPSPTIPENLPFSMLPDPVPQSVESIAESVGLLQCSSQGGVDVASGSTVILRAGWAENELSDLLSFVSGYTPDLSYDGVNLTHDYRAGPFEWQNGDDSGFQMDWFWEITNITAGTHIATWNVAGQTVSCEIRAQ